MGALRQVFATIGKYLGQMAPRDRVLIGSLAVVAALALVLVATTTSRVTMVELLPGMGPEDQSRAQGALAEADIAYQMRSGRVFITPEKRMYALALLQQSGKMPANADTLYSNLLKSQNWMASKSQSDQLFIAALCEFLGGIITNFKGVERASVIIDAPEPVGMGLAFRRPTASVGVTMKAGRTVDKDMVDAIAAMVAGSRAGLLMTNVKVVDLRNGRQFTARADEDFAAGDYLELVAKIEARVQGKVRELIAYDPGAIVAVSAQVDNTRRRTSTEKFLPNSPGGGTISLPTKASTTTRNEASGGSGGGAEPGVTSNVAADVNQGGGGGNRTNSTNETSDESFQVSVGSTREEIVDPRGTPTRVNVMISLSREYVSHLVKMSKPAPAAGAAPAGAAIGGAAPASAEPTQAELEAAFRVEKLRLETDLTPLIKTVAMETTASTDPRVVVSMIPVPQGLVLAAGGALTQSALITGTGGGAMAGLSSQLLTGSTIKTGFLGLLALVALGMMVMLVRKSAKPQELPTAQEIVGLPPVLEAEDSIVGEADESQTAMVGIELGDEEVRVKKVLEQVQDMVKKNPGDAANLLKRWMNPDR